MRGALVSIAVLATTLVAMPVSAQLDVSQQDLRNFAPPTDPESSLYLEKPTTEGSGVYNVGIWLSYANQLLLLESASGTEATVLKDQYSADYVASLGITDRVSVGLALPTVVYQKGEDEALLTGEGSLPRSGLGDLRTDVKASLLQPGTVGTLALGGLLRTTLPTSSERTYAGHEDVTGEARFLAELSFLSARFQATGGIRLRNEVRVLDDTLGRDLPWGAAALWTLDRGPGPRRSWVLGTEVHGSVGLRPSFADEISSPVLGGVSLRWRADDWSLLAGAETSFNAGLGGPRVRAVLAAGYAPRVKDADKDGLEDYVDLCPQIAEDLDGFQDSDGCPEVDNDSDGVSDTDDRCPKELEDLDDFQDEDGCPDPDNDQDGVLDSVDACPLVPGTPSDVPKFHGCPPVDTDGDGVFDDKDKCLEQPEDKDGFQDEDGCPERDNDRDHIRDERDACPNRPGPKRSDPKLNGCPSPDSDGDTFDDALDQCPDEREDFNGKDDEDGCPDADQSQTPPLMRVVDGPSGPSIELSRPIRFETSNGGVEVATESLPLLRAIGAELNRHQRWVLLVGVRPQGKGPQAEQEALNKSFAIVLQLRSLTHRDDLAESVSFRAVEAAQQTGKDGVGLMVLAPQQRRTPRGRK